MTNSDNGFTLIGPGIKAELKGIETRAERADSVTDPVQLAAEVSAQAPPNEEYSTEVGFKTVVVDGKEVKVHQTMSFPRIFKIYAALRENQPTRNVLEQAYKDFAPERGYEQIFSSFEAQSPNLYRKMVEVAALLEEQERSLTQPLPEGERTAQAATEEEKAEWDYYTSAAYNAMANVARQIDKHYKLEFLYKVA